MARSRILDKPTRITLSLSQEQLDDLSACAEAERVSMSTIARWAFSAYIEANLKKETKCNSES